MSNTLVQYDTFVKGIVENRPSKTIKSPYLADVLINGETVLCHSPSLGCNGHVSTGKTVLCIENKSKNAKSKYKVVASYNESSNSYVGTDPNISNKIVFDLIKNNKIVGLENLTKLKAEHKISKETRLDVYGEKEDNKYYIEVKTAPVKDEDTNKAIFPKGFRKKKSDPFSPRAIKHIDELIQLKKNSENNHCYLIFVVPRNDIEGFEPCNLDPLYCDKYNEAKENGINIIVFSTNINAEENTIIFDKFINI